MHFRTRAVAFDLDCTLVDVIRVKERAARAAARALVQRGVPGRDADLAAAIMATAYAHGIDADDVVDAHCALMGGVDAGAVDAAREAFEAAEAAPTTPYAGVRDALDGLTAAGFPLVVVTDAPRHRALGRLRASGLAGYFDTVVTLEDSPRGKEDATPFHVALARLGLAPHEVLVVGDNPVRDVAVPRAIGCRTALARYGLRPNLASPEHEALAHHELARPGDLLDVLRVEPRTPHVFEYVPMSSPRAMTRPSMAS